MLNSCEQRAPGHAARALVVDVYAVHVERWSYGVPCLEHGAHPGEPGHASSPLTLGGGLLGVGRGLRLNGLSQLAGVVPSAAVVAVRAPVE